MDTRKIKDLSKQEQQALRKSEAAMTRYVAIVTEIQTYRSEAAEITKWHQDLGGSSAAVSAEEGVAKLAQRKQLWSLEDKARNVFKAEREFLLGKMLPEHRQKMLNDVDPRISTQSQQITPGTLFQQPASTAPVEATEQKDWGCKIL